MKTKKEIVDNWLPRYTGTALEDFGEHVLLTNFGNYLDLFSAQTGAPIVGRDRPMPNATADGITMINFGMGSANAATVMDLLSAVQPKAVLLLASAAVSKERTRSAISCCRSPPSVAKAPRTTTCGRRFRHCPLSVCSVPCRP